MARIHFQEVVAFAAASLVLSGCVNVVRGTALAEIDPLVTVENYTDSSASVAARDTLTDLVAYWESLGVTLTGVRFVQWDSGKGDLAPMCRGSAFPQPAFCADGWLAWDIAWVRHAIEQGRIVPVVYSSRAVSDAIMYTLGNADSVVSPTSVQECFTGSYMSARGDSAPKEVRSFLTDVGAYVTGLESRDPLRDCLAS